MREFYQDFKDRRLTPGSANWAVSAPFTRILCLEGSTEEENAASREEGIREMLADIARRESDAELFGEGTPDWVVSAFHHTLGPGKQNTPQLTKEDLRHMDLSPSEISMILRHQRNGLAADVYRLRREGLSTAETAAKLEISEEEVQKAEHRLISLYRGVRKGREEGGRRGSLNDPDTQTFLTLLRGTYRIFRQVREDTTHYCFYFKDRFLGSGYVSEGRETLAVLRCGTLILNCAFDPGKPPAPGDSRRILDADNATSTVAQLTWLENGVQALRLNWDNGSQAFRIQSEGDAYRIFREDRTVARLLPLPVTQQVNGWELPMCMQAYDLLPDETAMLLMCFPLLKF